MEHEPNFEYIPIVKSDNSGISQAKPKEHGLGPSSDPSIARRFPSMKDFPQSTFEIRNSFKIELILNENCR